MSYTKVGPFTNGTTPALNKTNLDQMDQGIYDAHAAVLRYRKVSAKDVVSTTAETDLLNGEVTIAAGAMGTNGILRVTLGGDFLQNAVANSVPILKIKFGGTIFWQDADTIPQDADRWPWRLQFEIANLGVANAQALNGFFITSSTVGIPADVGLGTVDGSPTAFTAIATSADQAINTALAQALAVTVQHDTNSPSVSWRLKYGLIEVL